MKNIADIVTNRRLNKTKIECTLRSMFDTENRRLYKDVQAYINGISLENINTDILDSISTGYNLPIK